MIVIHEREDNGDILSHMPYMQFLAEKYGHILELGMASGNGSTRSFALGLEKCKKRNKYLISMDLNDGSLPSLFKESMYSLPHWRFVAGDSTKNASFDKVDEIITEENWPIPDIILFDTEHSGSHVYSELQVWKKYILKGSVAFFHDTFPSPPPMGIELRKSLNKFAIENKFVYADLSEKSNGFSTIYKKSMAPPKYF